MTDPKDLQHYLDEKMDEKNRKAEQVQERADQIDAQFRASQVRRHAALALLTGTIIPFLEESKKAMTGAQLVVHPKVTTNHQVIGVAFQIRDRKRMSAIPTLRRIKHLLRAPIGTYLESRIMLGEDDCRLSPLLHDVSDPEPARALIRMRHDHVLPDRLL